MIFWWINQLDHRGYVTATVEEAAKLLRAHLASLEPGAVTVTGQWLGKEADAPTRVAVLLALLGLARLGDLQVHQKQTFGAVWVKRMQGIRIGGIKKINLLSGSIARSLKDLAF